MKPNADYEERVMALVASAERELGAFLTAVRNSFGTGHAKCAAEEWVKELESIPPADELTPRLLRSITINSAARLATRLNLPRADTKVAQIRSSN